MVLSGHRSPGGDAAKKRWMRWAPTLTAVLLAIVTASQDAKGPDIRAGEPAQDDLPDHFRRNGLI